MKNSALFASILTASLMVSVPSFSQEKVSDFTNLEVKSDGETIITKNLAKGTIQVKVGRLTYNEANQTTSLEGNAYVTLRQDQRNFIAIGDEKVNIKGGKLELQIYATPGENDPIKVLVANLQKQRSMNYRVNYEYTSKGIEWSKNTVLYDSDKGTLSEYLISYRYTKTKAEVTHQVFSGVTDDILRKMAQDEVAYFESLTHYGCVVQKFR